MVKNLLKRIFNIGKSFEIIKIYGFWYVIYIRGINWLCINVFKYIFLNNCLKIVLIYESIKNIDFWYFIGGIGCFRKFWLVIIIILKI